MAARQIVVFPAAMDAVSHHVPRRHARGVEVLAREAFADDVSIGHHPDQMVIFADRNAADVVTLHPRVTKETEKLINAETLAQMKPSAILINTARGPLVDYDALYEALKDKRIRSAMLETFAVEPVPADWPLLKLGNVTLTPHIAGASVKTVTYAAGLAATEVRRYLAGEPPVNRC